MGPSGRSSWLLVTVCLLASCSSGGGGGSTQSPTFRISGRVSGSTVAGVNVALGGSAVSQATTDASGEYSFDALHDGSYTVTPTKVGHTFSPASIAVTIDGASVAGRDFTATAIPSTHAIFGSVTGAATAGVTLTLSGASSATTTTSGAGGYVFAGLADGTYTVTPSLAGHAFAPPSVVVTIGGADVGGADFVATAVPATHTVAGWVSGAVSSGVTIRLSGAAVATTTTGAGGAFSFPGLTDGGYALTPSLLGYTFSPASVAVTVSGEDVGAVAFVSTALPPPSRTLSGHVTGAVSSGVTVSLAGPSTASATTDAEGAYSFTVSAGGTYQITPSAPGFALAPSARTVTVAESDVSGLDFSSAPSAKALWAARRAALNALDGVSGASAWAVGETGAIRRWDGGAWSVATSGTTRQLNGVFSRSGDDAWAVGDAGTILRWNGTAWSAVDAGTVEPLLDVWAASETEAYAVGAAGTILHWDGWAWTPAASADGGWIFGVWGASGSDVWAVGDNGTILRWNGAAWSSIDSGTTRHLLRVWGRSASDVWAVGDGGTVLHWDGSAWSSVALGTSEPLFGVWGAPSGAVWVVGGSGAVFAWDGSAWTRPSTGTVNRLYDVWGSSATDVWACGEWGALLHWNGVGWSTVAGAGNCSAQELALERTVLVSGGCVGRDSRGNQCFVSMDRVETERFRLPSSAACGSSISWSGTLLLPTSYSGFPDQLTGSFRVDLATGCGWAPSATFRFTRIPGLEYCDCTGTTDWWLRLPGMYPASCPSTPPSTYILSGRVTGPGASGVTVTLGGAQVRSTTTDAEGRYAFLGVGNGAYSVTPARTGQRFTPASASVTVSGGDTAVDFVSRRLHSISGTVGGATASGVTVSLGGSATATTTTDSAGAYSFGDLENGSYTVTPSKTFFTFSPPSRTVAVVDADAGGNDFTAVANTYPISGNVGGIVSEGVTITLSGTSTATTLTGPGGAYSLAVPNGSYTLSASRPGGYTFAPATRTVTVSGAAVPGQDFTSAGAHRISGTVSGVLRALVQVTLGGAASAITTTDANGAYAFSGLANGTYTVTPAVEWIKFSPTDRTVVVADGDVTSNFVSSTYWTSEPSPTAASLRDIWGTAGDDVWAVGTGGTIVHWNGTQWDLVMSGTGYTLYGVRGLAADDVWAVGALGTVLRWNGTAWTTVSNPFGCDFRDVWGAAPDDVWIVGYAAQGWDEDCLVHWDGTGWSRYENFVLGLTSVWGSSATDVWAVGDAGGPGFEHELTGILHWNGTSWSQVFPGLYYGRFEDVWGASSTDAWAVGSGGARRWNGTTWEAQSVGGGVAVSGASASDIWSVSGTSFYHWDGTAWTGVYSGGAATLHGVWATSASDVWAVGDGGVILRYAP